MELKVTGMSCGHCKMAVETVLKDNGFKKVKVDLDNGIVSFKKGDISKAKELIESKGYTVES